MEVVKVFDVASGSDLEIKVDGFGMFRGMPQFHQKSRILKNMLDKTDKDGNKCFALYEKHKMFPNARVLDAEVKKVSAKKVEKKKADEKIAKAKLDAKKAK